MIGVDAERSVQFLAVAIRPYHQTPKGKSRFCYHLYYWCITHMQHPYGRATCCTSTVPVSEVVIRLTCHHSPLRQSKLQACPIGTIGLSQLLASHLRGWGSRLKLTTGSHCAPSHIRTGTQRFHNRHASLDPVCTWPLGHMFIYQSCQKKGSNVIWPSKTKPKTGTAGRQNLIEFIFY